MTECNVSEQRAVEPSDAEALKAMLDTIDRLATTDPTTVHVVTSLRNVGQDEIATRFSLMFVPAGVDVEAWCRARREAREARRAGARVD